jgi:hypothetical protein
MATWIVAFSAAFGLIPDKPALVGLACLAVRQTHVGQRLPHGVDRHADVYAAHRHVTGEIEHSRIQDGIDDPICMRKIYRHAGGSLKVAELIQRPLLFLRPKKRFNLGRDHQRTELRQLLSEGHRGGPRNGRKYTAIFAPK